MKSVHRARFAIAGLLAMAVVCVFGASAAPAAVPVPAAAVPLTGTFTPTQFVAEGDQLLAEGVAA